MSKIFKMAVPVAAMALLAGCAGGGVPAQSAASLSADAEVSGAITVWTWDVSATALKRLATDYTAKHPGTTIDVVDIGYDNAYDKMSVSLQAGSGLPDIITVESARMPAYISQFPKGFTDLKPLIDGKTDLFEAAKVEASSDKEGRLLSMPWDSGTVANFIRTDYFKEVGIDPASVKTWNDMVEAGVKIKEKTGHTLISTDLSGGGIFSMLLQQQGKGTFNAAGEIDLNAPEAVEALTLMQTMQKKGLLHNVKGWDGQVTAAKDGKSATNPEAVWWIGTLVGEAPELSGKYGVQPLPVFKEGGGATSSNGGSTLAVPTQAKNPVLAGDFVKFALANTDNQVSMMRDEGLFPSYLPAFKDPIFAEPQKYFGGEKVYELFAEQTPKILPVPTTSDSAMAGDIVANAVVSAVLNGEDPAKVLNGAAEQIATVTKRTIAKY